MEHNSGKYIVYVSNMNNTPIEDLYHNEIMALEGMDGSLFYLTSFPQTNEDYWTIWYEKKLILQRPKSEILTEKRIEKITDYFWNNDRMVTFLMIENWDDEYLKKYLIYCSNMDGKPIQDLDYKERNVVEGIEGILSEIMPLPDDNINRWYNKPYLLERPEFYCLTESEAKDIKKEFADNGKNIDIFTEELYFI